jgi:hypothetical protein
MKGTISLLVFLIVLASVTPVWCAQEGDIVMTIEITGMEDLMSMLMKGMGSEMGANLPGEIQSQLGSTDMPGKISLNGSIIIQGDNLRISLNDPFSDTMGMESGAAIELMVNSQDGFLYMYYPDTLNGYKVDMSKMKAGGLAESGGLLGNRNYDEMLKSNKDNVRKVGTKVVFGYPCTGYSVKLNGPQGKSVEADMWVSDELGFPIAIRTRMSGMNMMWEIHNINQVADMAASFFRPPGNALIEEMSADSMLSIAGGVGK